MKVIDLLNKIANGEELPITIRFYNDLFIWNDLHKDWLQKDGLGLLEYNIPYSMNNEIEITDEINKLKEK